MLEVLVGSQGISEIVVLHHDKRDTIRETPGFVLTRMIEFERSGQQVRCHSNDPKVLEAVTLRDEGIRGITIEVTERIANFDQDGFGNPHLMRIM